MIVKECVLKYLVKLDACKFIVTFSTNYQKRTLKKIFIKVMAFSFFLLDVIKHILDQYQ